MDFDTAILVSFPVIFLSLLGLERWIGNGRTFPAIRFWTLYGILGFLVSGVLSAVVPALVAPAMGFLHLLNLEKWALWGALPTVVLTTFFTYWSHRLQHRYDLLWRLGHQFHHSVMRVDIASGMIFHPIDVMVQVIMATLAATLLGVSAQAAALAGVAGFFIALYQHFNIHTPSLVGFLIQSPEAHILHHQRDIHARNFGDMPLWDMLFGTYAAPVAGDVAVGFEPDRSRRVLAMLACVDVNAAQNRAKL
jgi:sterol desaturase/sphingolipid hydroxylase (fatty acid hydroxylase superfamily)